MHTAQVSFSLTRPCSDEAVDAVQSLLAAWLHGGQILDGYCSVVPDDKVLLAFVSLPAVDALESRFASAYVSRALSELTACGVGEPQVTVLGVDAFETPACECAAPSFYILFTHLLERQSPVRCGDCFRPVPLCRLTHIWDHQYHGVLGWEADYKACDTLQIGCRTGERFAEGQMGDIDSELTVQGRGVAQSLADATHVPVYYYLHKARGASEGIERNRLCPICGGPWLLSEPLHGLFDFMCRSCRLLSSIPTETE